MEIDVTHMVEDADEMFNLSGSRMEHGQDAGQITWNNSIEYGRECPLLETEEQRDAARDHFRAYGAWSDEEIASWSEEHLQAITCQEAAAGIRELEAYATIEEFKAACESGQCSGRLYPSDDGHWYLYLGS